MILFLNELLGRVGGTTGGIYSSISSTGGAVIWDLSTAPIGVVVLQNGANILTTLNQVAGFIFPYRLTVIQPSSGAAGTINYPAYFRFPGGVAPTLSAANNAIDIFLYISDGTNVYLIAEGLNYS